MIAQERNQYFRFNGSDNGNGIAERLQPPVMASIGTVLIDVFDVISQQDSNSVAGPSHSHSQSSVYGRATPQQSFDHDHNDTDQVEETETYEQIGGGALYALIGARIWLPPNLLRTIVDRAPERNGDGGDLDLSVEAENEMNSFGKEIWIWNRGKGTKMTRSRIRYEGDVRFYQSIVKPPHRTIEQLFKSTLNGAEYLHISPPYSPEDVAILLDEFDQINSRRSKTVLDGNNNGNGHSHSEMIGNGLWYPKIVFEPHPFSCHPGQKGWLEKILPRIQVLSPNHEELFSFYSVDPLPLSDPSFKPTAERIITYLINEVGIGIDGKGIIAVRCGKLGACVATKEKGVRWCPAFWGGNDQHRVKDVTGAGNSFLGGFIAGLSITNDANQALLYGTVSSSFICEQNGLPILDKCKNGGEAWNSDSPKSRLEELRRRIDDSL